jgi:branched-chain amino acid transport system ATP-binding protein
LQSENSEELLKVVSLTKYFGGIRAVDQVTFSIKKGEVTGIIGPNGAGKTTLFNLITGFIRPERGDVIFKGKNITRESTANISRMGISRTFQLVRPFPNMTVEENVKVPAIISARKVSVGLEQNISKILDMVGLLEKRKRKANTLAHAELKMLEIARAIATGPDLLLLDEPYGGLSKNELSTVTQIISKLSSEGITIMIIEHRLSELMKSVRRVVVMDQGKVIADGIPEEVVRIDRVIEAYLGKNYSRGGIESGATNN